MNAVGTSHVFPRERPVLHEIAAEPTEVIVPLSNATTARRRRQSDAETVVFHYDLALHVSPPRGKSPSGLRSSASSSAFVASSGFARYSTPSRISQKVRWAG